MTKKSAQLATNVIGTADRCDCDTPLLRKAFLAKLEAEFNKLAKEHELEIFVASHNPTVISLRGCLIDKVSTKPGQPESIEVAVLVSGDLRRAEREGLQSVAVHQNPAADKDVLRSFDLSEAVSQETAAGAMVEAVDPCAGVATIK